MDAVLESATRKFISEEHIRNLLDGEWVDLFDDHGHKLKGIRGRIGVSSISFDQREIGVDYMEMEPGSEFPLHFHDGDHILYIISGNGYAQVKGKNHPLKTGDTIYVPANEPHAFKASKKTSEPFQILSFGYPHKHLSATDRMHLISEAK
jgi:quercetin dioxygenase-like cupin family protein